MVCGLWITILMGVYGDIPGAGLTALLQDRKEKLMSKEEDTKLTIDLSNYENGIKETVTVDSFNGISADDLVTVTSSDIKPLGGQDRHLDDIWSIDNALVSGAYSTDTVTLREVEFDFQKTDVKQGDLFNGWPEDGPPVTITTLKED